MNPFGVLFAQIKQWFERREAVDLSEKRNLILIGIAAVALLVAGWIAIGSLAGGDDRAELVGEAYYMDMQTGEIFTRSRLEFPPIKHNGNPAYRVTLFGCGSCAPGDRVVGRYERHREEDLQRMREQNLSSPPGDPLVSVDGETWHPLGSPAAGQAYQQHIENLCDDGELPKLCKP